MKAILIYEESRFAGYIPMGGVVRHKMFRANPSNALASAIKIIDKMRSDPHTNTIVGKYIHIDGRLLEITEKPSEKILRDATTGIEI